MAKNLKSEDSGYRWIILAMTYVCMLSFALVFQSIPPILALIISEFQITGAQAGLLMGLFALPALAIAIPSGFIVDRLGAKTVALSALVIMILGTLILGLNQNLLVAYFGRIISGIGASTLSIVLPQMLSQWFIRRELGLGMGVFNTAMPLGTILSFSFLGNVGKAFGWRTSILLTTFVSVVALFVFLWLFKSPPPTKIREPEGESAPKSLLLAIRGVGVPIWIAGVAWLLFNASFIAFLTFAPDFFVFEGYEIGFAGFMTSIVMMGSLILSPVIGFLVYKFRREEPLIGLGGLALAALLFFIPTASSPVPLLILIGLSAAFVPAPIFSLPSKLVKPENLGLSFGILATCANLGTVAGPYLAGLAKDVTASFATSFYFMAFFALLQTITITALYFSKPKPFS